MSCDINQLPVIRLEMAELGADLSEIRYVEGGDFPAFMLFGLHM
jgi:hypothetical protein